MKGLNLTLYGLNLYQYMCVCVFVFLLFVSSITFGLSIAFPSDSYLLPFFFTAEVPWS